jgi:chitin synthase
MIYRYEIFELFILSIIIVGEDRWLCTLMLQQGYRIEYCAAAEALTFAPEEFREFFNQRRRWLPSTMANILDLLLSTKIIVFN